MHLSEQSLLDTSPNWLSLTLLSLAAALVVSGLGVFFSPASPSGISPFVLLLHLVWAIAVSAATLNFRMKLSPDRKALLAVGLAVAVGSMWSSIQQWIAYVETGLVNDFVFVAAAMAMDAMGGTVSYVLSKFNMSKE